MQFSGDLRTRSCDRMQVTAMTAVPKHRVPLLGHVKAEDLTLNPMPTALETPPVETEAPQVCRRHSGPRPGWHWFSRCRLRTVCIRSAKLWGALTFTGRAGATFGVVCAANRAE